jgi:hypothetical protein
MNGLKKVGFLTVTFEFCHGDGRTIQKNVTQQVPLESITPEPGKPFQVPDFEEEVQRMVLQIMADEGACEVLVLGRRSAFGYAVAPAEPQADEVPAKPAGDASAAE